MPSILTIGKDKDIKGLSVKDNSTGQLYELDVLPGLVAGGTGFIAGSHLYSQVAPLNQLFRSQPGWVFRVDSRNIEIRNYQNRVQGIGYFLPAFFGWRSKKRSQYWRCMDLYELAGKVVRDHDEIYSIAAELLAIVTFRGITWNPTKGGLGSRLYKASPEWERGRRAAPRFINDLAREQLPGNHYGLNVPLGIVKPQGVYIDQTAAHHAAAAVVDFPHPHETRARGHHWVLETGGGSPWLVDPDRIQAFKETHKGMIAARVTIGHTSVFRKHLQPEWMNHPGRHTVYFYSNEWEYFDGTYPVTIDYLTAAWTSADSDPVPAEYARWSMDTLKRCHHRDYLKPILLAAYGSLATRTDTEPVSYWQSSAHGQKVILPLAGEMTERPLKRPENGPQPRITHVIARGMIEAETRMRSLRLARELTSNGYNVYNVYVDGLIIGGDKTPFLPPGWTLETNLTHVRWYSPNSFSSVEVSKLPGIPAAHRERRDDARIGRLTTSII